MGALQKAAFGATYKSVWCAGSSLEFTTEISTVNGIVERFKGEIDQAQKQLFKTLGSV